jgi:ATP-dependent DNA ligase
MESPISTRCIRAEVQLCAFDILAEGREDLRKLPLSKRKANLERLLARRPFGHGTAFHHSADRNRRGIWHRSHAQAAWPMVRKLSAG